MNRVNLRFYTYEFQQYHTLFLYEWLLVLAHRLGIKAGTATRATAGYGRFTEAHAYRAEELTVNRTIIVEFIVTDDDAEKLLAMIAKEAVQMSYTRHPVEYHEIGSAA